MSKDSDSREGSQDAAIQSMMPPRYLVGTAAVTENLLKRKWSTVILRHLDNGVNDPGEICKLEADLTPMALSERLRSMLRFSLIARFPRYPRNATTKVVEYRLTSRGQKILKMLTMIEQLDELNDKNLIALLENDRSPGLLVQSELPPRNRQRNKSPGKTTH